MKSEKTIELEKTLTLRKPVKVGDQDFLVVNLCEPTAKHLSAAASQPNGPESIIELVSLTAKVPRVVAENMGARDHKEAERFFEQFLG